VDLERSRKQAKALVRAVRAGEPEAAAWAERVLGARARERFVLADAQHVVAREQGARSWRALRARGASGSEPQAPDGGEGRAKVGEEGASGSEPQALDAVEAGAYREGAPVVVRVRKRGHRVELDDGGAAAELAGRPRGWLEVAEQVVDAAALNVNRRGRVFVTVHESRDLDELARRVGETSRALYAALLELDDGDASPAE
jgi:hypothetical protein